MKLNFYNDTLKSASLGETPNTPEHVIQTIKEKIDLLNKKQYDFFNRYDLYVLVDTTCIDINHKSYVKQIIDDIADYQEQTELKYKMLYLAHHYVVCICNLDSRTFEHKAIPRTLQEIILESITSSNKK